MTLNYCLAAQEINTNSSMINNLQVSIYNSSPFCFYSRHYRKYFKNRFAFLASSNLNKFHDFGEGHTKWGNFKSLLVSTHYTNNLIRILINLGVLERST